MEVRPFRRPDLRRIVEIERVSFGKDAWPATLFLAYWRETPELFLVARHGRHLAGYSISRIDWRGAEVDSIAVDPRYRGRGVAKALLDTTLTVLRAKNCGALRLMVSTANATAIRFYLQYGFVRTRRVKDYYGKGRDAWRMRLGPK